MESRLLLWLPADPHKRLIWSSGLSFMVVSIVGLMLGAFISLQGGRRFFEWNEVHLLWGASFLICIVYIIIGRRISRPSVFYVLERLPGILMGVLFLDAGLRLIAMRLGAETLAFIVIGLVVGLVTLPWRIRVERAEFRAALDDGYLRNSLDQESNSWDPQYDSKRWEDDQRVTNPGFLRRLLFWTGPAIGMALSDLIGQSSAQAIAGAGGIYAGYILVGTSIQFAISRTLELNRLELELGNTLRLARQ